MKTCFSVTQYLAIFNLDNSFKQNLNYYLNLCSIKICIQGVCTASPSAPTGDCLFGDDPFFSNTFTAYFGISLPNQMNCQQIIDYATNNLNTAGYVYCQDSRFQPFCCNTCKSKRH